MGQWTRRFTGVTSPSSWDVVRKGVTFTPTPPVPGTGTELTTAEYGYIAAAGDGNYLTVSGGMMGYPYYIVSWKAPSWLTKKSFAIGSGHLVYGGDPFTPSWLVNLYLWNPATSAWDFQQGHSNAGFTYLGAQGKKNVNAPPYLTADGYIHEGVISPVMGMMGSLLYVDYLVFIWAAVQAFLL